jgi:hypothetical protein
MIDCQISSSTIALLTHSSIVPLPAEILDARVGGSLGTNGSKAGAGNSETPGIVRSKQFPHQQIVRGSRFAAVGVFGSLKSTL